MFHHELHKFTILCILIIYLSSDSLDVGIVLVVHQTFLNFSVKQLSFNSFIISSFSDTFYVFLTSLLVFKFY